MTRMIALDDVKALLPIRGNNTSYDDRLTNIIDSVSAMIEGECRQSFARAERIETHTARQTCNRALNLYGDGDAYTSFADEQIIPLRASPIDAEAAVTVWYDPSRQFTDDTIVPADCWSLDAQPDMSRILLTYPTRYMRSALRVRYTAGFAVGDDGTLSAALKADAPDLFQAVLYGCLHEWNRLSPEVAGTDKDENGGTSKPNSLGLPKESLVRLQRYRRVLTGRG